MSPLLFALCLASACAEAPRSASSNETTTAPTRPPERVVFAAGGEGPVRASLEGPKAPRPDQPIELVLRLERRLAVSAPVHVDVRVPPSVRMTQGKSRAVLDASTAARSDELRYVVAASGAMPVEDLVVVVDIRGTGFGYHAELPYRFGRPEPVPEAPAAQGQDVRVGGRTLGRSVDITPGR